MGSPKCLSYHTVKNKLTKTKWKIQPNLALLCQLCLLINSILSIRKNDNFAHIIFNVFCFGTLGPVGPAGLPGPPGKLSFCLYCAILQTVYTKLGIYNMDVSKI